MRKPTRAWGPPVRPVLLTERMAAPFAENEETAELMRDRYHRFVLEAALNGSRGRIMEPVPG